MTSRKRTWLIAAIGCMAVAALSLTACGGSGSSSSGGGETSSGGGESSSAGSAAVKRYESELNAAYKGNFTGPTGGPVKPPPGKNVWVVTSGLAAESAIAGSKAMEEAGEKIGWNVTTVDGKFESSRQLSGVEQAVTEGADGIVLLYVDCAPIKAGLEQAQAAGIKVVGIESKDCEPSLETEMNFRPGENFLEWSLGWGGTQSKWVIGKTEGEAKTILTVETDLQVTKAVAEGVKNQFDKCPTCEIVEEVTFVGTELGPPLQQKIEQALAKHPEANSFIAAYDAILTSGGAAAALRGSGRLEEIEVMGGEGSKPGIEMIYDHSGNDACTGLSIAWTGYQAIMQLARGFAGQDMSRGAAGIGWQACDIDHNLPPKGESFQPPVDFVADYERLWGLK